MMKTRQETQSINKIKELLNNYDSNKVHAKSCNLLEHTKSDTNNLQLAIILINAIIDDNKLCKLLNKYNKLQLAVFNKLQEFDDGIKNKSIHITNRKIINDLTQCRNKMYEKFKK